MAEQWAADARRPDEYHVVEAKRGREFIIRMTTGADVFLGMQKFAVDNGIRFAKIHAAFMGGLQPARYLKWIPDYQKPDNWHLEACATVSNLSMILAMGGIIHTRTGQDGGEEPFPAIHFVAGGGWDCASFGGHLERGSLVKGVMQCFITEILGIERVPPVVRKGEDHPYPENWYRAVQ